MMIEPIHDGGFGTAPETGGRPVRARFVWTAPYRVRLGARPGRRPRLTFRMERRPRERMKERSVMS